MTKDPVCGMNVDEKRTKLSLEYKGKKYYFCAPECKAQFEKHPEKYALKEGEDSEKEWRLL